MEGSWRGAEGVAAPLSPFLLAPQSRLPPHRPLRSNSRKYPTLAGRAAPHTPVAMAVKAVVSHVPLPDAGHMAAVICDASPSWAYPS